MKTAAVCAVFLSAVVAGGPHKVNAAAVIAEARAAVAPAPDGAIRGVRSWITLAALPVVPNAARIRPRQGPAGGAAPPQAPQDSADESKNESPSPLPRESLCLLIESEALTRDLPPVFFARLIWQESRFDPLAVSPVGASGIAQFMPATAAERGLDDPFDAITALGASADLLRDLAAAFGNIGLAAAAYNAGPGRVQGWLKGRSGLPAETRHYVRYITGREAEAWKTPGTELARAVVRESEPVQEWCRTLPTVTLARPGEPPAVTAAVARRTEEAKAAPAWGVQLAAYFSEQKARQGISAVKERHGKLLGAHEPQVVTARAPARGRRPLYAVRVVTDSRAAAQALCATLKSAGGECLVLRN